MTRSRSRQYLDRRTVYLLRRLHRALVGVFRTPILPARYADTLQRLASPDRLHYARRAALLGIGRMPQRPGLWVRTTNDGDQRVYRVRDCNGELYATVGRFVPVAVPTARLPGYWDHVE